jgi:integrase
MTSTCKQYIKKYRAFIKWYKKGIDPSYIDKIDYELLERGVPKTGEKEKPYLTEEEFHKLLEVAPKYYATIYKLMASSGIRVAELSRLNAESYNGDTGEITLKSKDVKVGKSRTFNVPEVIKEDLQEIINTEKGKPLIKGKQKERISPNSLSNIFADHCMTAGLGKRNIHLLRAHAIEVILKEYNGDYELVRKICGWSSKEMERYFNNFKDKKEALAKSITFEKPTNDVDELIQRFTISVYDAIISTKISPTILAREVQVPISFVNSLISMKPNKDIEHLIRVMFGCSKLIKLS